MIMAHCRLRYFALSLLAAACVFASGCLTSIDDACATAAETHCGNCFSCAEGIEGISGAELCGVPTSSGTTRADCEDMLTTLCERQARSMQDPFQDLDECQTALDDETCGDLVERFVLDQPDPPMACIKFL
jgi:hypothetical protein